MTFISLVCLLALSSSVFGRSVPLGGGYGGGYGGGLETPVAPRMANIITGSHFNDMSSGLLQDSSLQTGLSGAYGSALVPQTRTLTVPSYGSYGSGMSRALEFDATPLPVAQPLPLTEFDILCRGQRPETVIPIENNRRFVVCLDDGKGTVQDCPKGLFYHEVSRRCERKLGPSDNLCASQPCFNGGQCLPTDSWFQCQCAPGFEGPTCELDARVCQQQQPCGSGPGVRCQSFRLNAALQYICLFQDETAYGLTSQQIISSPCAEVDGPHALTISELGFIMCDGERMFVESCPGGTIWDNRHKACVWRDSMITDSLTIGEHRTLGGRSGYGSGYGGETRTIINKPTYGGYGSEKLIVRPRVMTSYGGDNLSLGSRHIESGYGGGYGGEKVIVRPKFVESGYGGEKVIERVNTGYGGEKVLERVNTGYGGEKVFVQPKFVESGYGGGYGGEKTLITKTIDSGYGGQKFFEPKFIKSGYGGEKSIISTIDSGYGAHKSFEPKVVSSGYGGGYGGEKTLLTKTVDSGYGGGYGGEKTLVTKTIDSGYGGEKLIVRPRLVESGYGGEKFLESRTLDTGYGGEKLIVRPRVVDSGYGGEKEEMISIKKVSGGY